MAKELIVEFTAAAGSRRGVVRGSRLDARPSAARWTSI